MIFQFFLLFLTLSPLLADSYNSEISMESSKSDASLDSVSLKEEALELEMETLRDKVYALDYEVIQLEGQIKALEAEKKKILKSKVKNPETKQKYRDRIRSIDDEIEEKQAGLVVKKEEFRKENEVFKSKRNHDWKVAKNQLKEQRKQLEQRTRKE